MCRIKSNKGDSVFGSKRVNNVTIFGGSCHALVESNDGPDDEGPPALTDDPDSNSDDEESIVNGNEDNEMEGNVDMDADRAIDLNRAESTGVMSTSRRVTFAEGIYTIVKSRSRVSKRDQIKADRVRRLQHVAGFPSDETSIYSVLTNGIKNNPISKRDVQICNDVLGRIKCIAQGKTTMKQSDPVDVNSQIVKLPPATLTHYSNVQLAADVMCVNDVPFLTSMSNHLHHGSSSAVDNLKTPTLEEGLRNIIRCYNVRGFSISIIFVDIQFKFLKDRNVLGVTINVVSRGEQVKQIERFHRLIEERCRCYCAM